MATKKSSEKKSVQQSDLHINKTYKLFINGAFPRTESGRYFQLDDASGNFMANICLGSRKDFRNAVVAARSAQQSWQDRAAFNKSQIVYRIAEMLDQKRDLFVNEMIQMGYSNAAADKEFTAAVDLVVYYAGWCDKYMQVFSNVNPVASSHFNFSVPEPTGIVATMASERTALTGIIQAIIPPICGGNTVVALASEKYPATAISFAEVLATSDVPGGVINILTGKRAELYSHFASHMDVNAVVIWDAEKEDAVKVGALAADSVKRTHFYESKNPVAGNPDFIINLQETKTTWHPIQNISGSKSGY